MKALFDWFVVVCIVLLLGLIYVKLQQIEEAMVLKYAYEELGMRFK